MRAYFAEKAESPYYNSDTFKKILDYLKYNFETCKMIEKKGKLSMKVKNIKNLEQALRVCKNIIQD